MKKQLVEFLGLNELATKYGLGNDEVKFNRRSKGIGGKTEKFATTTDGQWQLQLPIMLAGFKCLTGIF